MRSLLFVPGDSDRKLAKSLEAGADALILDLEDSVAPNAKGEARRISAGFLAKARREPSRPRLIVRVNALETGLVDADLDAVMPTAPDAIMLPKARGGADIGHLAAKLAVREAEFGLPDGGARIIAIATETAGAIFGLASYAGASHRLDGLAWGAEDLAADVGAERNREAGVFTEPFRLVRNLSLFAAVAANVAPIDTVYVDFRDAAGLAAECLAARRDGFTAKLAIHPNQVAAINRIFTPGEAEIARAQRILAHFAAHPEAGVTSLEGEMIDRPHIRQSERIIARARAAGLTPSSGAPR